MIVSFEHRFLFIKGIKVASTSIEAFLSDAVEEGAIVTRGSTFSGHRPRNYISDKGLGEFTNHMSAAEARRLLGPQRFDSMRRLAVVRDPFEKVRSFFFMMRGRGYAEYPLRQAIDDCSSEADRLSDGDGRLLATDIVRYEDLDSGLSRFFSEVGLPFPGKLPHREKSWHRERHGHAPAIFSAEDAAAIRKKFDFEFSTYSAMRWPEPVDPMSGRA